MTKVLIVDDNTDNLYFLEVLLKGNGCEAMAARNGAEALESALHAPPDLIVSDILMPVMDGFTLCRTCKSDERLKDIPFIFYTATYLDKKDEELGLSIGADRYIMKPQEPETLMEIIQDVLDGHQTGTSITGRDSVRDEAGIGRKYNEALFRKLEKKVRELEQANLDLVRSIEERKQAEEEKERLASRLFQAQKMEALGTLAGGIAHDFNNILLAIGGNAHLAATKLSFVHPAQENLSEIVKGCTKATDLVRRILTFGRPQEESKNEVLQLRAVAEEALGLIRVTIPAAINIRTCFAEDTPSIIADSGLIYQVMINLAMNASHAIGPDGGLIEFRIDETAIRGDRSGFPPDLSEGRYVRLTVSDNGCGMDPATLERIFDPFFTTKGPRQGTGLGLSIVYGIMKSLGGSVFVLSRPGKGSTFELYFPFTEDSVDKALKEPRETSGGQGKHILYVDDDHALVLLMKRVFEEMGYMVTACADPHQGLRVFLSEPGSFDVLVTDMSMPGMSGFDLARAIRATRPDFPVIVTSGYVRHGEQEEARRIGIFSLILKPNAIDGLKRDLDTLFHDTV